MDVNTDLPDDLISYLRAERRLEYDVENSEIGRIRLKKFGHLSRSTITIFPNCQSIIEDPYGDIDGLYHIDVYDLVAKSENYGTEGLLCWIIALQQYGCVDPEHGDVLTFPGVTWTDITKAPQIYLDAQWGFDEDGEHALPWLYFPFKIRSNNTVLSPYGTNCPIHGEPIGLHRQRKPRLYDVLRRRELDEWLHLYVTAYPCSGVPVNDDELLCCDSCRAAENLWIAQIESAIKPLDARLYSGTWVKCPSCDIRFSTADASEFGDGMHLSCGQKINVIA